MENNDKKRAVTPDLLNKIAKNKWLAVVQAVFIAGCTWALSASDAYFMNYILIAMAALACLVLNQKKAVCYSRFEIVTTSAFSLLFAIMIALANYKLWNVGGVGIAKLILTFVGTFISFANILFFLSGRKSTFDAGITVKGSRKVFLYTFLLIVIINGAVLFMCKYPGFLSFDSSLQVKQVMDGAYNNSHPFYHTMILKAFVSIGLMLFGNMNAAIATYMVFQICFMAAAFAFAVMTLNEIGAPKWSIIVLVAFFALMPYHVVYSITLWKDIIFGGMVLFYTLFLFRMVNSVGNGNLNTIGVIVSGIGYCLLRSNGLIAFVGTTLLFLLVFKFRQRKLAVIMTAVIVTSFVLKHPVLKMLDVPQPDITESLSIPLQQVALDVIENDDFTEREYELINQVADVERIPETYLPYISDPIKELIRERGNQKVVSDRKSDYIDLYFSRLLKHPLTYVKAWVEQTKGYWNSGYSYWIWDMSQMGGDFGIRGKVNSGLMNKLVNKYLSHFLKIPFLKPLVSIGLFVWSILIVLYLSIIKKDKMLALMTIPSLMVILTLLVATPVFSEFRYAYSVFCTAPVIWLMAYVRRRES